MLDAGVPPSLALLLRDSGHDPVHVQDVFPPGTTDHDIASYAIRTGRCLITRDFDFANIRSFPPHDHTGLVVLFVPSDRGSQYIRELLEEFVVRIAELAPLDGKLFIVERGRIRTRE